MVQQVENAPIQEQLQSAEQGVLGHAAWTMLDFQNGAVVAGIDGAEGRHEPSQQVTQQV